MSPSEFKSFFSLKLSPFILHRFSAAHTTKMIDNLLETLRENEVVLIQDFSENYSSLLPHEPQITSLDNSTSYCLPCSCYIS